MSLLDFDDDPVSNGAEGGGQKVTSADLFDPFAMPNTNVQQNEGSTAFDDFDPFSAPALSPTPQKAADSASSFDPFAGGDTFGIDTKTSNGTGDVQNSSDPFGLGQSGDDPFGIGQSSNPFSDPAPADSNPITDDPFGFGVTGSGDNPFGTSGNAIQGDPFGLDSNTDSGDPFGLNSVTGSNITGSDSAAPESKMADLEPGAQKALEAQFDDLMGDMTDQSAMQNGEVTMTTERTVDGVTTVTTVTKTSHVEVLNGESGVDSSEVVDEMSQLRTEETDEIEQDSDNEDLENSKYFESSAKISTKIETDSIGISGANDKTKEAVGTKLEEDRQASPEVTEVAEVRMEVSQKPTFDPYAFDFMEDLISREVDSKMTFAEPESKIGEAADDVTQNINKDPETGIIPEVQEDPETGIVPEVEEEGPEMEDIVEEIVAPEEAEKPEKDFLPEVKFGIDDDISTATLDSVAKEELKDSVDEFIFGGNRSEEKMDEREPGYEVSADVTEAAGDVTKVAGDLIGVVESEAVSNVSTVGASQDMVVTSSITIATGSETTVDQDDALIEHATLQDAGREDAADVTEVKDDPFSGDFMEDLISREVGGSHTEEHVEDFPTQEEPILMQAKTETITEAFEEAEPIQKTPVFEIGKREEIIEPTVTKLNVVTKQPTEDESISLETNRDRDQNADSKLNAVAKEEPVAIETSEDIANPDEDSVAIETGFRTDDADLETAEGSTTFYAEHDVEYQQEEVTEEALEITEPEVVDDVTTGADDKMDFSPEVNDRSGAKVVTKEFTHEANDKPTTFGNFEISPSGALIPPKDLSKTSTKTTVVEKQNDPAKDASKYGMFEISPSGALIPPKRVTMETVTTTTTVIEQETPQGRVTKKETMQSTGQPSSFGSFEISPTGALVPPKSAAKSDMKSAKRGESATVQQEAPAAAPKFGGFELSPSGALIPPSSVKAQSQSSDQGQSGERNGYSPGRLEDTLSDYQPPKRYVKQESETRSTGPSVYITPAEDGYYVVGGFTNGEHDKDSVEEDNQFDQDSLHDDVHLDISRDSLDADSLIEDENELKKQAPREVVNATTPSDDQMSPSTPFGSLVAMYKVDTPKPPYSRMSEQLEEQRRLKQREYEYGSGGGSDNMCSSCNKRVYEMEKVIADKGIYHKACFKCTHCRRVLTMGNFAAMDGRLFCQPHFLELFKTKGSYKVARERTSAAQPGSGETPPVARSEASEDVSESDVIRSEGTVEELPENLPSISNLKSRFESPGIAEQQQYVSRSVTTAQTPSQMEVNGVSEDDDDVTPRDPEIVRETFEKEEVHFAEMSSVRNKFETISQSSTAAPSPVSMSPKRPDRRNQPKSPKAVPTREPAPVEISREEAEVEVESELPPAGFSRNLVAKFREYEAASPGAQVSKKSTRKVAPPRHEPEPEVVEVQQVIPDQEEAERDPDIVRSDNISIREEELPSPAFTQSMLQKFRSLETTAATMPPSPSKQAGKRGKAAPAKAAASSAKARTPRAGVGAGAGAAGRRASPDSGIAESDIADGQRVDDVIREGEEPGDGREVEEEELPQRGMAKNLLAQWRSIEVETSPVSHESTKSSKVKRHHTVAEAPTRQRTPQNEARKSSLPSQSPVNQHDAIPLLEDEELGGRAVAENEPIKREDVIRGEDPNETEYLPPPKFTKSLLAKFQNLETESHHKATPKSTKKSFKWQVKEAKPLFRTAGPEYEPIQYDSGSRDSLDQIAQSEASIESDVAERRYYDDEPAARDPDVVTSDTPSTAENELPPPSFTRNLLAKFKSLEDVSKPPPTPERSQHIQHEAVTSVKAAPKYLTSPTGSSSGQGQLNDSREYVEVYSDGQSQEQYEEDAQNERYDYDVSDVYHQYDDLDTEGGEYENEPISNPDVVREHDDMGEDELPERGTARNLMAKWQAMQGNTS